jgi:hypothetical protein
MGIKERGKNKAILTSKEEEKELINELKEDAKYKAASITGKKPSDVVVEVKKTRGAGHGKISRGAGGKVARRPKGKVYKPTDDDYNKVEEMVIIGLDQHTISKIMGISNATLIKYYKHTLETAREKRTASVAGVAYKMAMSGDSAAMTTFWLKTQGGWTPKQHVIHEDKNFDISWSEDEEDIADANRRIIMDNVTEH